LYQLRLLSPDRGQAEQEKSPRRPLGHLDRGTVRVPIATPHFIMNSCLLVPLAS